MRRNAVEEFPIRTRLGKIGRLRGIHKHVAAGRFRCTLHAALLGGEQLGLQSRRLGVGRHDVAAAHRFANQDASTRNPSHSAPAHKREERNRERREGEGDG